MYTYWEGYTSAQPPYNFCRCLAVAYSAILASCSKNMAVQLCV
jgi:hypothetical protein